jgi:hypothetical protein
MRLLVLEVEFVVGTGVGIEAVVPARGLRPFRRRSRDLLLQPVQQEEEDVANCYCCLLVDQSRIVRDSGGSRCQPVS